MFALITMPCYIYILFKPGGTGRNLPTSRSASFAPSPPPCSGTLEARSGSRPCRQCRWPPNARTDAPKRGALSLNTHTHPTIIYIIYIMHAETWLCNYYIIFVRTFIVLYIYIFYLLFNMIDIIYIYSNPHACADMYRSH